MHLTKLSLALALAGASAQMYCPAGHGMYTTTVRVSRSEDDVEEAEHPTGKCAKGMLYQGSSDLELGNDVECGATGQYIGIRFQNLDVPSGAKIMTAHLKFTVDESTNPTVEGGSTTSYWGNWTAPMTVTIHGRKTPDAGPWLDPASKDPHVASNRDCTLDSKCMPGYDCNSLASSSQGWGINGGSTHPFLEGQTCEWYENGGYVDSVCDSGIDSTGEYSFCSWIADKAGSSSGDMETDSSKKVRQCDCSACFCGRDPANPSQPGFTAPHILSEILKNEVTDAIQVWHPEGEDISKDQISERRPTMVTPEIRAIVQEIVDMGGWSPGNSIAFIIDGIDAFDCKPGNEGDQSINNEGGGGNCALRTFESFDGANKNDQWWTSVEPPYGPHLEVSYCAPVTCPEGQMPGTAVMRVEQGIDDVEEAQSAPDRIEGMLYQGSSDLELANDATGHGAQYFGVRFQGVPIPAGSTVKSATMMLSIDESTNTDEARYNEFVTAHIKMRKTADAPEWLPKDSTDPAVVANRDCPLDSKCMSGYTCHDIAGWASYGMPFPATAAEASANDGSPTTCAWIEKNAAPIIDQVFGGGNRITKSDTCDCTGCNCDFGMGPKPAVLKKIWEGETTANSVAWEPGGEHLPDCEGVTGCEGERRVQFTPDLSEMMNEVVSEEGWKSGNAVAILVDGADKHDNTPSLRAYESWNGANNAYGHSWTSMEPLFGPTLWVSYCMPPGYNTTSTVFDETGAIVGGVIGGVAGLCLLACGILVCCMIRKEKRGQPMFQTLDMEKKRGAKADIQMSGV